MDTKLKTTVQGTPTPGARGHERRDVSVGWIFGVVLFLFCSGFVIHLVVAALLQQFISSANPADAWRPVQNISRPRSGSSPLLQISPRLDLRDFRAQEDKQLTGYGWIDRTAGVVRVPIDRAMELVLQKGLPVATNSARSAGRSPQELILDRLSERKPGTQNKP
jgi:hypothetical protein